jgi:hypothetical protein
VNGLSRLLQVIGRAPAASAERPEALQAAIDDLGRAMTALRSRVDRVAAQLEIVHRQIEQLAAIRREDADAAHRLDALERVLDADRAAAHIGAAVARAERVDGPVPYLIIAEVLPDDVYTAAIEAIPPPIFFDQSRMEWEAVRLPPSLAPTYSVIAWKFLLEVVERVLAPALVVRFQPWLDSECALRLVSARLVRRPPGSTRAQERAGGGIHVTTVLPLARPDDDDRDASDTGTTRAIPFRSNTAIAFLDSGAHAFTSTPAIAAGTVTRCWWECHFGPRRSRGRRSPAAIDPAVRAPQSE